MEQVDYEDMKERERDRSGGRQKLRVEYVRIALN